jgi:hypothetical protein
LLEAAASTAGDGDSSISFWWRRCTEQSRFAEVHAVAVRVGEHLNFNVARTLQRRLDQQAPVAERVLGFRLRLRESFRKLAFGAHEAHAASAAARSGLDHHRILELVSFA